MKSDKLFDNLVDARLVERLIHGDLNEKRVVSKLLPELNADKMLDGLIDVRLIEKYIEATPEEQERLEKDMKVVNLNELRRILFIKMVTETTGKTGYGIVKVSNRGKQHTVFVSIDGAGMPHGANMYHPSVTHLF